MSFYRCHIFVCTNQRGPDAPKPSCGPRGGQDFRDWAKDRAKALGIKGIRINQSGCLGLCARGPVMVVYPDGVWYAPRSLEDMERILSEHLRDGVPVDALRIQPPGNADAAQ